MGLAIAYGVAMSMPVIGGDVAHLIWGGEFPGAGHPVAGCSSRTCSCCRWLIATLIALHLTLIVRTRHTQFRGPPASERHVVGTPMWPGYALRSLGLLLLVAGMLVHARRARADQPDLAVGAVRAVDRDQRRPARLVPGLADRRAAPGAAGRRRHRRLHGDPRTRSGAASRSRAWCSVSCTRGRGSSSASSRATGRGTSCSTRRATTPGAQPIGAAFFAWVVTVFAAGAADRFFLSAGVPYTTQVWIFRGAIFAVPVGVFLVARRWTCR